MPELRVGIGVDAHAFSEGVRLVLGGVAIEHPLGLAGHSDGDVIAHALIDAVLGAAGLGDIGRHFPPSDAAWKDADSMELLARVVQLLEAENYQVVNVDVTVVAEAPRIGPHVDAMRASVAAVLGVAPRAVSIKGKSNEGLGWVGRGEGIAVHAVALIDTVEDQGALFARHRLDAHS